MSNLDSMMQDDYFDETENFSGKIPQGVYPANIIGVEVKPNVKVKSRVESGKNHMCDVYTLTYKIAPEAANEEYPLDDDKTVNGNVFVGKTVKGKGIFKFKSITEDNAKKGFIPNAGGNRGFKMFLDSIGFPCKTKEITDSRGTRTVTVLPDLVNNDVNGIPVLVTVQHREWKGREGDTMIAVEVSKTKEWESGKPLENDEDIPF